MIFQPKVLFGIWSEADFSGAVIGCGLAMVGSVWVSTLILAGWVIISMLDEGWEHKDVGFLEWWLISGVILGAIAAVLDTQNALILFILGSSLVWFGPAILAAWFASMLLAD